MDQVVFKYIVNKTPEQEAALEEFRYQEALFLMAHGNDELPVTYIRGVNAFCNDSQFLTSSSGSNS